MQPQSSGTCYVLTTATGADAKVPASGCSVFIFAEANGGAPTLTGTTTLAAPYPTAMGMPDAL